MSDAQSWPLPCGHDDGFLVNWQTGEERCASCGAMVPDGYVPGGDAKGIGAIAVVVWGVGLWACVIVAICAAGVVF